MGIQILLHISVVLVLSPLLLGIIGKTKAFLPDDGDRLTTALL